jgi:hypothetical protein
MRALRKVEDFLSTLDAGGGEAEYASQRQVENGLRLGHAEIGSQCAGALDKNQPGRGSVPRDCTWQEHRGPSRMAQRRVVADLPGGPARGSPVTASLEEAQTAARLAQRQLRIPQRCLPPRNT